MAARLSNWIMAIGAGVLLLGLCVVPAIIERRHDLDVLAAGSCLFGLGALMLSCGMYVKASRLRFDAEAGEFLLPRRTRGGCELCATESPVIHCKVHQLQLCGNCLGMHYDFRSCSYVPSTRTTDNKTAKARGASQGSATQSV